jgi:hypothetical protein
VNSAVFYLQNDESTVLINAGKAERPPKKKNNKRETIMKKMMRTTALGGALVFMAASAQAMDDGFMVGNTTFKLGGYVDLDVHMTEFSKKANVDGNAVNVAANSIVRDMYIPGATPTALANDMTAGVNDSQEYFDFQAETSRLSFTAMNGDTKGYIEIDFLGDNADERVSNSHRPRIRRAFVQSGNWLMGQEWTTFQNLSAIPERASFLTASDGQIFVRQQMVRWTNGPLQVALENPGESRFRDASETSDKTADGGDGDGAVGRITSDQAERPDIVVRFNYKADFGNISASVLNRQIKHGDLEEDGISYNIAGRVKAGPGDVRFSYSGGEGMGRYIGLHAANEAYIETGDAARQSLELIESTGYVLAYRLPLGRNGGRLNIGPVRWKSMTRRPDSWKPCRQTMSLICGARNRSSLMASNI